MAPPPRNRFPYDDSDSDSGYDDSDTESEDDASHTSVEKQQILPMDLEATMAIQESIQNIIVCRELFASWKKELRR